MTVKVKRKPFSFKTDGPEVERMYLEENKSVSQIAKMMGRGYNTIKNYLEQKNLYTGPATRKSSKDTVVGYPVEKTDLKIGQRYWSSRHGTTAVLKGEYNEYLRIYLNHVDYQCYAYCRPAELRSLKGE